jgi:hypothetical protein
VIQGTSNKICYYDSIGGGQIQTCGSQSSASFPVTLHNGGGIIVSVGYCSGAVANVASFMLVSALLLIFSSI